MELSWLFSNYSQGLIGETLSTIGITGLYITFVLGVGRLLRLYVNDLRKRIPYENLPNADRCTQPKRDVSSLSL